MAGAKQVLTEIRISMPGYTGFQGSIGADVDINAALSNGHRPQNNTSQLTSRYDKSGSLDFLTEPHKS